MKDRETVIEALQYMISGDCTETQFDYTDDIEAAIDMLKEQEAVKSDSEHRLFVCPVCRSVLRRDQKFCHECGKRIKWERR